ncbi:MULTISPECIES: hypothetical protein [unclassified Nonomuraea]|uniref:hypothetical protein n=1 Tax=unclassified Nonomuraea TaxID=2593643 RepID=UPI00191C547C|nr:MULTISPECIES: hypothetical protein [unclassified Nonomuraea]
MSTPGHVDQVLRLGTREVGLASPGLADRDLGRQAGHVGGHERMCVIAEKVADAHRAWRDSLAGVTLADILTELPEWAPARLG